MGRPLKVFTTGPTIVPSEIAAAVGQRHHVGQASVYVSAPTKASAYDTVAALGMTPSVKSRFQQVASDRGDALTAAGLFADPTVLVTHLNGSGPVVRVADDGTHTVVGQLVSRDRVVTFIPAADQI
jgi:hypothetical protein